MCAKVIILAWVAVHTLGRSRTPFSLCACVLFAYNDWVVVSGAAQWVSVYVGVVILRCVAVHAVARAHAPFPHVHVSFLHIMIFFVI